MDIPAKPAGTLAFLMELFRLERIAAAAVKAEIRALAIILEERPRG